METFIAIWENTWEATWCGGCGWRSTDPSTRLTQNSFKVLDKSCPARKSILKWKKPPCTVWRKKFCCCCWGFLFVLFWGEVWGWSKETKQKDILSSWLRERKDRGGGGGGKKYYILGFLCQNVFTLSVDYLSSGRWCFLFLWTKTTLLHTQVCPDSSTPPQILCPSVSTGQRSPIPPAAATLHPAAQQTGGTSAIARTRGLGVRIAQAALSTSQLGCSVLGGTRKGNQH